MLLSNDFRNLLVVLSRSTIKYFIDFEIEKTEVGKMI